MLSPSFFVSPLGHQATECTSCDHPLFTLRLENFAETFLFLSPVATRYPNKLPTCIVMAPLMTSARSPSQNFAALIMIRALDVLSHSCRGQSEAA